MNIVEQHLRALAAGIDLVAAVGDASVEELTALGPASAARELVDLHRIYFGQAGFARRRATAVEGARKNKHSLPILRIIEGYASRLRRSSDAWVLRAELCQFAGDEAAIIRRARLRLRELQEPPQPKRGVRFTRGKKFSKMTLTAEPSLVEDLRANIDMKNPVDSFIAAFREGRLVRPTVQPLGILSLADYANVELVRRALADAATTAANASADAATTNTDAATSNTAANASADAATSNTADAATTDATRLIDEDVTVRLSNGTSISGRELVERALAEQGLVMLVDRVGTPVDLYRTARLPNDKQRTMTRARTPRCAWPGCLKGADTSQVHHVKEWQHGGETNIDNLICLCPHHNGANGQPGRGRMVIIGGRPAWIPPGGGPPVFDP